MAENKLANLHNVHFIGIGGAGMSALAYVLIKRGYLKLISEMNENINNKNLRIIPTGLTTEKDYEIMNNVMRSVI